MSSNQTHRTSNIKPHIAPHIAFIGGGNMATAIITGMIVKGGFAPSQITVVEHNETQREHLSQTLGVHCYADTTTAGEQMNQSADIWVLAVKPQNMKEALAELTPYLRTEQILLSIAAGLPIQTLANWANQHAKIVRTMPNTPALVGQGITGVFATAIVPQEHQWIENILQSIGQIVWLQDESQIDAITAISGSGPAYVFYMMEQLVQDAQNLGFDADTAKQLVQATFAGAVTLAGASSDSIATLRERVTSKGGTTAAALNAFASKGLDHAIHAGVAACKQRAEELVQELSV